MVERPPVTCSNCLLIIYLLARWLGGYFYRFAKDVWFVIVAIIRFEPRFVEGLGEAFTWAYWVVSVFCPLENSAARLSVVLTGELNELDWSWRVSAVRFAQCSPI